MALFRALEKRVLDHASFDEFESDLGGLNTYTGRRINKTTAMQMIAVWFCVGYIADQIAGLPVDAYRSVNGRSRLIEPPAWLALPNTEMIPFDYWHRLLVSLLLAGNAYAYTLRNASGAIIQLIPIHPDNVDPFRDDVTGEIRYHVHGVSGSLGRDRILHIPGIVIPGEIKGLSPIEAARQSIGIGLSAEEYGARFFGQGAHLGGVIQTKDDLKPAAAEVMALTFAKHHSGTRNAHLPGVLTGGAEWKAITVPPEEAQCLETRRYQKVDIALLYHVAPYKVDPTVASSWGSGIVEQNRGEIEQCFMPWIIRLQQAHSLLMPAGQSMKFNLDARLRGSLLDRYGAYKIATDSGFLNRDEARAKEDMDPIPNGKGAIFTQPMNMAPLGTPAQAPKESNNSDH